MRPIRALVDALEEAAERRVERVRQQRLEHAAASAGAAVAFAAVAPAAVALRRGGSICQSRAEKPTKQAREV
jgi:hypothetical protein